MELINFCHPYLNPVISCDKICDEGYEVKNLVSKNSSLRRKGFMVYRTIKPPVDIVIEFTCKIHLSYLVIFPQVGCQKSSDFVIFNKPQTIINKDDSNVSGAVGTVDENLKIGYSCLSNEVCVVFRHPISCSMKFPPNYQIKCLSNKNNNLNAMKTLVIRISRTLQSSVPSIGAIEVWGWPSKSCSNELKSEVQRLWNSCQSTGEVVQSSKERTNTDAPVVPCNSVTQDTFSIPEDFIDPITCEMMVLPVILPSGKVIDQSTLEAHKRAEAVWGRTPSDPFTGRVFTNSHKPVLAVALKARLDKFLVENSERKEIQSLPRTVGRCKDVAASCTNISRLLNIKKENVDNCKLQLTSEDSNSNQVSIDSLRLKRKGEENCGHVSKVCKVPLSSSSRFKASESTYEEELDNSLELALKSTLSGLPTFVQFENNSVKETPVHCCIICESLDRLYHLPCNHLLCWSCLVQKTKRKNLFCDDCKAIFKSSDPLKYHS